MMTTEDLVDDIEALDFNDPEIAKELKKIRNLYRSKGLPYRELFASKFFNHSIKYLAEDRGDGFVTIVDLDTGREFHINLKH